MNKLVFSVLLVCGMSCLPAVAALASEREDSAPPMPDPVAALSEIYQAWDVSKPKPGEGQRSMWISDRVYTMLDDLMAKGGSPEACVNFNYFINGQTGAENEVDVVSNVDLQVTSKDEKKMVVKATFLNNGVPMENNFTFVNSQTPPKWFLDEVEGVQVGKILGPYILSDMISRCN